MSRSRRISQQRRQEQIARQQALTRRRRIRWAWGAVGLTVVLVASLVVVRLAVPPSGASAVDVGGGARLSSSVTEALAVRPAVLDQVGRGAVASLPVAMSGQEPLAEGAKPLVVYIGAEYCPFCAAQRWALVVALSRFGSFGELKAARSASDDVFPSTATVSFYGATYTSDYLAFQGVELATSERQGSRYAPLQSLTAAQEKIMRVYNAPPYVAQESAGAVPFVDFGNRFLMSGAAFSPSVLKGLTQEQVAAAFADPTGPVAQAILGAANAMTGALCQLTALAPATVCKGPAATAFPETAQVKS